MNYKAEYKRALRAGRRQYAADIASGQYPYLQVLEELTQNLDIVAEVPLGVCDVQLEQIVGTNAHGRSTSFASNFMPLLEENTEFAHKWTGLCKAHIEEGIRDPIKCYEFMNRYYVIEGNKRVSVLKFYGAVDMRADVTRIVPRPDGSTSSNIYQEYIRFYRVTQINYLVFTKEGSYDKLLEILGRPEKEQWEDDDFRKTFHSDFTRFRALFSQTQEQKLDLTPSDAFLEYLKIYPFDEMAGLTDDELKQNIQSLRMAYQISASEAPVAIQMQPEEEEEGRKGLVGILSDALGTGGKKHLKAAFVYDKSKETSAWTYAHELGRLYVADVMKDEIDTTAVDQIFSRDQTPDEVLNGLCDEGYDVIFTTTPVLINETIRAAVSHPKVKFLNCSVDMASTNIRTYYGRMYEAKFLSGLIAGSMTKVDKIDYVADYPIPGIISSINAFARGVQLVNPRAKVHLYWSTLRDKSLNRQLHDSTSDLVSLQDMITPGDHVRRFGLYDVSDPSGKELAMPLWNWGKFYERILRSILSGSWSELDEMGSSQTINYWWGLSSGVIDLITTSRIPEGTQSLVSFFKKAIILRSMAPFDGHLLDQTGLCRSEEEGYITTADIVKMNWLLNNVEGKIPSYEELNSQAQLLVKTNAEGNADQGVTVLKSDTERL